MSSLENTYRRMVESAQKPTTESKMDPVGAHDKDIDNDGDHDKTDKYLINRRKKISAAVRREEVEEIEELSKKTLGSYIKKSTASLTGISANMAATSVRGGKAHPDDKRQFSNRLTGVHRATNKLTSEDVEQQIDEVSNDTMRSYLYKAVPDYRQRLNKADKLKDPQKIKAAAIKLRNRRNGVEKASAQLTKEETMTAWPVYNRIHEKSSRADHYKGATPPQPHGDNWAGKDREFINKHGGVGPHKPDPKFDDVEIDVHPDNGATKNIKVAPKRHNDSTIGDKAMPKAPPEAK